MKHRAECLFVFCFPGRKITELIFSLFKKYKVRHKKQIIRLQQISLYFIDHFYKLPGEGFQIFSFYFPCPVQLFQAQCISRVKCIPALSFAPDPGYLHQRSQLIVPEHPHLIIFFIRKLCIHMDH